MRILVLAFFVLNSYWLTAQENGSVRGQVTDMEMGQEPLMYSQIILKNDTTKITTQTNLHGNYELIELTPGKYTLSFAYVGYETKSFEIEIGDGQTVWLNTVLATKSLPSLPPTDLSAKGER